MGGTMEYGRLRMRADLTGRRMEGDPYSWTDAERTLGFDALQGEMNRMEQSYMGDYAGLSHLPDQGAAVTGLTREQVLAVMRWFFCLPEPGCEACARMAAMTPIQQRCNPHQTGDGLTPMGDADHVE
jgi:hypothetical protein